MKPEMHYPSKRRTAAMTAASLAFAITSAILYAKGNTALLFPALFFTACSSIFVACLFPSASFLKIDQDGFTFVAFFRKTRYQWNEVDDFRVDHTYHTQVVLFDAGDLNDEGSVFGSDVAALPDVIGFRPDHLVRILKAAHIKYKK